MYTCTEELYTCTRGADTCTERADTYYLWSERCGSRRETYTRGYATCLFLESIYGSFIFNLIGCIHFIKFGRETVELSPKFVPHTNII